MKPPYDAAVRDAVRIRMSPPNRESVTEIARDTGITTQTLYNWRLQWQKQGQLVPATDQATGAVERRRQAGGRDSGRRAERSRAGELLP